MFWQSLDTFLTRIRPRRQPLSLLIDAAVVALCWQATYLFRLGFERWIHARPSYDGWVLLGVVACYALVFQLFGMPKGIWRFSGFGEIKRLAGCCFVAGLICAVVVQMAGLLEVPRAVLAAHPVIALIGVCGVRMAYRTLYEHMRLQVSGRSTETRRALVLGAGDAARRLLAGIQHEGWAVVGLLDDDPTKREGRVAGVPVLGPIDSVAQHGKTHGITHLIIAMPSAKTAMRRRVIDVAAQTGLPVLTVPGARELQDGAAPLGLRDIQPEDLLGREPVELDEGGIAECLNNKVVLITGAGGSIGSELCRQVARYGPSRIVLYELSEFNLYTIEQELTERFPKMPLVRLIGDAKDLEYLRFCFNQYRPQIVFHAAAYKHVPLMEEENAWGCLRNNVLGTYCAALAAMEVQAERFVLVSTDKAVNPTNVMGASKRAAEMVLSSLARREQPTKLMAVRFGNVLGSSGSVIPKFQEQLAKGGPLTVTHPEITRYFMTIPEAASLVLQAATMANNGQVYVLDMGEPVKILDLARNLLLLAGRRDDNVTIEFTGLRPGEKLFEELLADADVSLASPHPRLRIARLQDAATQDWLDRIINWLMPQTPSHAEFEVRQRVQGFVPEYQARML